MKNIIRLLFVSLAVMFGMTACDVLEEPYLEGAENENRILEFCVGEVSGEIDDDSKTIVLDFPGGTDVSHMTPFIVVSTYATVAPASGVPQDFTEPVYYTVTAFNGSTVQYRVDAVVHDTDNEKSILSFKIEDPDCEGVINELGKTVTLHLPENTDVTHLVPVIEVSEGATVEPASGVAQDFTQPVTYTVTAQNGTTAAYEVTAIVLGGSFEPSGKVVLIKDFTGARCVNCPAAAEAVHQLQHTLGEDHVLVMSVHAGYLATPVGQFPNFLTEEGTIWYNNNLSNPLFSVDHVALTEGNTLYVDQVDAPVIAALGEEQSFEIIISNSYDEASRTLNTTSRVISLSDFLGEFYVTVCLVEDNIVGWQTMPGSVAQDYVFHDVFRGTLNGADGASFDEDGAISTNQEKSFNYSIELDADYDADNCYILTYIYDKSMNGMIFQSSMKKIN